VSFVVYATPPLIAIYARYIHSAEMKLSINRKSHFVK
jgi:hypothetical protein